MQKYYKISGQWAEKLGEKDSAVRHPDGLYLVLPSLGSKIASVLQAESGGGLLSPEDAFSAIGAVGLDMQQALASSRGELRHDIPAADPADNPSENPDSTDA